VRKMHGAYNPELAHHTIYRTTPGRTTVLLFLAKTVG